MAGLIPDLFDSDMYLGFEGASVDFFLLPPPEKVRTGSKTLPIPFWEQKTLGPHKHGCLMLSLPIPFRKLVTDWTLEHIPDFWLTDEGREPTPHVTIVYGFRDNSLAFLSDLRFWLAQMPPLEIVLEDTLSLFTGGKDGDVLKVGVICPQLHQLHEGLVTGFDVPQKFPDYLPHITLAYLDPKVSARVLETLPAPAFCSSEVICDEVEWSGADGVRERITLGTPSFFGWKSAGAPL